MISALYGAQLIFMSAIRVLVLEDSLIIAMEAEDILRLAGVESIDIVGSVEQARAAIAAETYDFALLDVNLGEGMGTPGVAPCGWLCP